MPFNITGLVLLILTGTSKVTPFVVNVWLAPVPTKVVCCAPLVHVIPAPSVRLPLTVLTPEFNVPVNPVKFTSRHEPLRLTVSVPEAKLNDTEFATVRVPTESVLVLAAGPVQFTT